MSVSERKKRPMGVYLTVFLVLYAIRTGAATSIDCGGKAFYCLNSTNFMICVDQGNGVALTVDDMSIPCPPGTECQPDNIFECEFPRLTTPSMSVTLTSDAIANSTSASVASILTTAQDKNTTGMNTLDYVITDSPINVESLSTFFDSKITPNEESVMNISESKVSTEKELLVTTPLTQVSVNSSYNTEGLFVTTNYEDTLITQEVTMNTLSDFTVNTKPNAINVSVSTVPQPRDNVKNNGSDYSTNSPITEGKSKNVDFTEIIKEPTAADASKSGLSSHTDSLSTTPLIKTLMNSSQNTERPVTVSLNYNDTSIIKEVTMNTLADSTTDIINAANENIATVEQPRGTTEISTLDHITAYTSEKKANSKPMYLNNNTEGISVIETIAVDTQFGNNSEKNNLDYITAKRTNITNTSTHTDSTLTPREEIAENKTKTESKLEKDLLFITPLIQESIYSNKNSEGIFTTEITSASTQFGNNTEKNTIDYITSKVTNITTGTSTHFDAMVTPREEILGNKTEIGSNLQKDQLFNTSLVHEPMDLNKNSEGISTANMTTVDTQFGNKSEKSTLDYITTSPPIMTADNSTYLNSSVTLREEITGNKTETGLNSKKDLLFTTPLIKEPMYPNNNSEGIFTTESTSASTQFGNNREESILDYITKNLINSTSTSIHLDSTLTPREEITGNKTETGLNSEKDLLFTTPLIQEPMYSNNNSEGIFATNMTLEDARFRNNSEKSTSDYITTSPPIMTANKSTYLDTSVTLRDEITENKTEAGLHLENDNPFTTPSIQETIYFNNNSEGISTIENAAAGIQFGNNSEKNTLDSTTKNLTNITTSTSIHLDSTLTPREAFTGNKTETGLNPEKDLLFTTPLIQEPMHSNNNSEGIFTTEITSTSTQFGNNSEKNTLDSTTKNLTNITSTSTHLDSTLTPGEAFTKNKTEKGLNSEKDLLFTTPSIQEPMHSNNNSEGISTSVTTSASIQYGNASEKNTTDYITTKLPNIITSMSTNFDAMVTLSKEISGNKIKTGLKSENNTLFTTPSTQETTYSNNNNEGIFTTEITSASTQFGNNSEKKTLDYITKNITNVATSTSTHLDSILTPREEVTGNETETGLNSEKDMLFTTPSIPEPIYSNNNSEGISTTENGAAGTQFGNNSEKNTLDSTTKNLTNIITSTSTHLDSTLTPRQEITGNETETGLNSEKHMLFTTPSISEPIYSDNNSERIFTTENGAAGTHFGNNSERNTLHFTTKNLTNITTSTSIHLDSTLTPQQEITGNETETGLNSEKDMLFTTPSISEPIYSDNNSEGISTTENGADGTQFGNNSEKNTLDSTTKNLTNITTSTSTHLDSTLTPRQEITGNETEKRLNSEKDMLFTTPSIPEPIHSGNNSEGISTTEKGAAGTQFRNNSEKNTLDFTTKNLTNITTSTSTHLDSTLTPRQEITGNETETRLNSEKDMLFTTPSIPEPIYSGNNNEGISTTEKGAAGTQFGNNSEKNTLDFTTKNLKNITTSTSIHLDSTLTPRQEITGNETATGLNSEKDLLFTTPSIQEQIYSNNNSERIFITATTSTSTQFGNNSEKSTLDYTTKNLINITTSVSTHLDSTLTPREEITGNETETRLNSEKVLLFTTPSIPEPLYSNNNIERISTIEITSENTLIRNNSEKDNLYYTTTNLLNMPENKSLYFDFSMTSKEKNADNKTEKGLNPKKEVIFTPPSMQEKRHLNHTKEGFFINENRNESYITKGTTIDTSSDFMARINNITTNLPIVISSESTYFSPTEYPRTEILVNETEKVLNSDKDLLFTTPSIPEKLYHSTTEQKVVYESTSTKTNHITTNVPISTTSKSTYFDSARKELGRNETEKQVNPIRDMLIAASDLTMESNTVDSGTVENVTSVTQRNVIKYTPINENNKKILKDENRATGTFNAEMPKEESTTKLTYDTNIGYTNLLDLTTTESSNLIITEKRPENSANSMTTSNNAVDFNTVPIIEFPSMSEIAVMENIYGLNTTVNETTPFKKETASNISVDYITNIVQNTTPTKNSEGKIFIDSMNLNDNYTDNIWYDGTTQKVDSISTMSGDSQVTMKVDSVSEKGKIVTDIVHNVKAKKYPGITTQSSAYTGQSISQYPIVDLNSKSEDYESLDNKITKITFNPLVSFKQNLNKTSSTTNLGTENNSDSVNDKLKSVSGTIVQTEPTLNEGAVSEILYDLNTSTKKQVNNTVHKIIETVDVDATRYINIASPHEETITENSFYLKNEIDITNEMPVISTHSETVNKHPKKINTHITHNTSSNIKHSEKKQIDIVSNRSPTEGNLKVNVIIDQNPYYLDNSISMSTQTDKKELSTNFYETDVPINEIYTSTEKTSENFHPVQSTVVNKKNVTNEISDHNVINTLKNAHSSVEQKRLGDTLLMPSSEISITKESLDEVREIIEKNQPNIVTKEYRDIYVPTTVEYTSNHVRESSQILFNTPSINKVEHVDILTSSTKDHVTESHQILFNTPSMNKVEHVDLLTSSTKDHVTENPQILFNTPSINKVEHINILTSSTKDHVTENPQILFNTPSMNKVEHVDLLTSSTKDHVTENPQILFNTPSMNKVEHVDILSSSTKDIIFNVKTELETKSELDHPSASTTEASKYNKRNIYPGTSSGNPTTKATHAKVNESNFSSNKENILKTDYHNTSPTHYQRPNFSCANRRRGRYSDLVDCKKFYICVGKHDPIIGRCPSNTVFSDSKKQCTKILSECVRQHGSDCTSEGRFVDNIVTNFYYICVRNKNANAYVRFRFQCQTGYYLRTDIIKCIHYETISNKGTDSRTVSTDESSRSDSSNKSDTSLNSSKERKTKSDEKYKNDDARATGENQDTSSDRSAAEFRCVKEGKFPDHGDCTKYYECKKKNGALRRKRRKCDKGEVFHKQKKKCVDADSHECT